jgi:hypothetical protein
MESIDLRDIDRKIQELNVQKSIIIEDKLISKDPVEILKAQEYVLEVEKKAKTQPKAYLYSPEKEYYSGFGYKSTLKGLPFEVMRQMGDVPIINSVISTRIEQVQNFLKFTDDLQRSGYTIRRKLGRFEKEYKLKESDKKIIEGIADFLEDGGLKKKWDGEDDLDGFVRKILRDSLELDQACWENERNKRGQLIGRTVVDAATIRILETIEPKNEEEGNYEDINGYLPIYAQVYNQHILKHWKTKEPIVYYPWELAFIVRNPSSSIKRNGYGKSELEILAEIVTYILWGVQYNGNFFRQGSNPKGFFTIEGEVNQTMLNEFRDAWRNTMTGVGNSHKVPVFEGSKILWQDMQIANKDMEFQQWNQFLMLLTCSVYKIDPSELGFQFQNQTTMFGQDGQKQRLDHSREKGLKPLLRTLEKAINKWIVSELNPDFEFCFTGIDLEDEGEMLKNDAMKVDKGMVSMEDMFKKYSGREFDPKKDTILNNVYLQAQQMKQYGGEESNQAVNEMSGAEDQGVQNPFDEYEKSVQSDPIMQQSMDYINKMFNS